MKDNIKDFVESWKKYDQVSDRTGLPPTDWHHRFKEAGYHSVSLNSLTEWQAIHTWCTRQVGKEHYAWTGQIFWFETQEAANWFTLRWL